MKSSRQIHQIFLILFVIQFLFFLISVFAEILVIGSQCLLNPRLYFSWSFLSRGYTFTFFCIYTLHKIRLFFLLSIFPKAPPHHHHTLTLPEKQKTPTSEFKFQLALSFHLSSPIISFPFWEKDFIALEIQNSIGYNTIYFHNHTCA